jgi:hypothetical protein
MLDKQSTNGTLSLNRSSLIKDLLQGPHNLRNRLAVYIFTQTG